MEGQDRFIMRELDDAEVGLGEDREEALADVGNNHGSRRRISLSAFSRLVLAD